LSVVLLHCLHVTDGPVWVPGTVVIECVSWPDGVKGVNVCYLFFIPALLP